MDFQCSVQASVCLLEFAKGALNMAPARRHPMVEDLLLVSRRVGREGGHQVASQGVGFITDEGKWDIRCRGARKRGVRWHVELALLDQLVHGRLTKGATIRLLAATTRIDGEKSESDVGHRLQHHRVEAHVIVVHASCVGRTLQLDVGTIDGADAVREADFVPEALSRLQMVLGGELLRHVLLHKDVPDSLAYFIDYEAYGRVGHPERAGHLGEMLTGDEKSKVKISAVY